MAARDLAIGALIGSLLTLTLLLTTENLAQSTEGASAFTAQQDVIRNGVRSVARLLASGAMWLAWPMWLAIKVD